MVPLRTELFVDAEEKNNAEMMAVKLLLLFFAFFSLVFITAYPLLGHSLIKSAYRKRSPGILNKLISENTPSPLESYLKIADNLWSSYIFWMICILTLDFLVMYLLKQRGRQAGFRVDAALFLSTLLALAVGGEVFVRFYDLSRRSTPLYKSIGIRQDGLLGWVGEKIFGDPETDKLKIFIVGDSFTAGGSPVMYYETLRNRLDAELFVYGGNGYGTLQEFLVIDKYLDEIRPDLILLQVCANDFINNHWELESRSCFENYPMARPYRDARGKMSYRHPWKFGGIAYFMMFHSRLAHRLLVGCQRCFARLAEAGKIYTVENDIEKHGLNFRPYRESFEVTGQIASRIKDRIGDTPLVVFTVSEGLSRDLFKEIFEQRGVPFIAGIPDRIISAEAAREKLRVDDGIHWNQRGHSEAGAALLQELVSKGLLPESSRR